MLNYEISGTGKENLVLLHGFMENLLIWEEIEEKLSQDFTLIKIDLPGHGLSKIYSDVHSMELNAEAVSYTHLDVYKRQDSIFNHEENFYSRFSLFTSFLQ